MRTAEAVRPPSPEGNGEGRSWKGCEMHPVRRVRAGVPARSLKPSLLPPLNFPELGPRTESTAHLSMSCTAVAYQLQEEAGERGTPLGRNPHSSYLPESEMEG